MSGAAAGMSDQLALAEGPGYPGPFSFIDRRLDQNGRLQRHAPARHMLAYESEKTIGEHWLLEEAQGADLLATILEIRARAHEDHRDGREQRIALERGNELQTIHEGHLDVGEDEIRTLPEQEMPRYDRVLGKEHLVACIAEMHSEEVAHQLVVLHHEDCGQRL
jgi:hypothetical protein